MGLNFPIENESLLPSQHADTHRRQRPFAAERRMWCAAFEEHLKDASGAAPGVHTSRERRRLDALEWIADDSDGLLSFRWYADALGLDATAVRKALASGTMVVRRHPPVHASLEIVAPREYARRYREKNAERLRRYNTEYCRERRA